MGIVCMCKRCAGTGVIFVGRKPFSFKRGPRCSGKGGKIATPPVQISAGEATETGSR